ncbi:MAG TPA: hypothetical protein VKH42_04880 [Vicinamibacterales bacterium]|nr:hypothetical protein [Vicinamibacterales bacterium]
MRDAAVLLAVLLAIAGSQLTQVDKKPAPKGSEVVMVGCLAGNTLIVKAHGAGTDMTYALRGSKERLKAIRKEFDHQLVEVTGFVHDSPQHTSRGMVKTSADGRTRVSANASEDKNPNLQIDPPTLDVESVKKTDGACR